VPGPRQELPAPQARSVQVHRRLRLEVSRPGRANEPRTPSNDSFDGVEFDEHEGFDDIVRRAQLMSEHAQRYRQRREQEAQQTDEFDIQYLVPVPASLPHTPSHSGSQRPSEDASSTAVSEQGRVRREQQRREELIRQQAPGSNDADGQETMVT
jgi:hypothetical protein